MRLIDIVRLLNDRCDVTILEHKVNPENGRSEAVEKIILKEIPCHFISLGNGHYVKNGMTPKLSHSGILIVDRDIEIPMGCKISILQNGYNSDYAFSGMPIVYSSHREIPVAVFERWI